MVAPRDPSLDLLMLLKVFHSTTYDIPVTDPTTRPFYTSLAWPLKILGLQCALDVSLFCHTWADDPPDSA